MKKLFLLLALFGVLSVSCDSFNDILTPNGNKDANYTFVTDNEGDYIVDAEGGEIVVAITTDIEYDVVIPTDAQSWLSVADTRAETRMEKLKFIIAPNSGTEERSAMVELVDNDYNTLEIIYITQTVKTQASANKEILYTTTDGNKLSPYDSNASVFGAILVSNTYSNGRGVLVFDDEVTSIGDYAFTNCRTLASITIPESVTYIGRESFGGCSNLTSITIPESVTSLGYLAFAYCNRLSEFKGNFASDDGRCLIVSGILASFAPAGIKEYTIPTSVTKIGVGVFYGCDNLKNITIPKSVTKILPYAFKGYTGSLVINCNIPAAESGLEGAFYGGDFTSVTIGNSVTTIGDYAFNYCSSLTSVTIGDSVTTIGDDAFYGCSSLTSVTIPDSVTTIGEWAFCDCSSLISVTIPDSVTTIGERAFYNCSSLTSVTIGDSVTTIGNSAFSGCTGELVVNCNIPSASSAPDGAFYGSKFTSVTIGNSVTTIGDYAFYDCSSLTSVTIPDSVTTIGDRAFHNCTGSLVVNCNIPAAESGSEGAFCGGDFTSVTIGNSVTTIGDYAFYNCSNLTSITIPNSVTTIGDDAFYGCTNLTSVTIPNSVTTIGDNAFQNCSSLTSVTIGDSVTSIGEWAFNHCDSLTSVTIPDSVTTIGDYAFYNCSNLTSVTIGDSVTTIGRSAFSNCTNLTSVYCKATTPPVLGSIVFYNNASGRKIYVPMESVEAYMSAQGWNEYASSIEGYNF